mmetsp:Transcript_2742/g.7859  ORF Transcript_2742/g.7859 Transcript_2742/m.7859 type:complete len:257 (+) Transcript_2742:1679-2449(+)
MRTRAELGEHHHARVVARARVHVLERVRVDALSDGGEDGHLEHGPHRHALRDAHGGYVHEHDTARCHAVHALRDEAQLRAHSVRVLATRGQEVARAHEHLHKGHAPLPLGLHLQQLLEGEELERDAAQAFTLVNAAEQHTRPVQSRGEALVAKTRRHTRRVHGAQVRSHHLGLDAHVRRLHHDGALLVAHSEEAARHELVLEAEHALAAREEGAGVLEEVEADEVCVEHAAQQLVAHGDGAEDLRRGEGRVQEEAH